MIKFWPSTSGLMARVRPHAPRHEPWSLFQKIPKNCHDGTLMARQPVRLLAKILMFTFSQSESIRIQSVVERTFWFFVRPSTMITQLIRVIHETVVPRS